MEASPQQVQTVETIPVALSQEVQDKLERLSKYEGLNLSPEDVNQLATDYLAVTDKHTRLEAENGALKKQAPVDQKTQKKDELRQQVRDEVLQAIPELAKLSDLGQVNDTLQQVLTSNAQVAVSHAHDSIVQAAAGLVRTLKVDLTSTEGQEVAGDLAEHLERIVMGNPQLLNRYTKGDTNVGKDARKILENSRLVKNLRIPQKVVARKAFTTFADMEGEPGVATVADIVKDLPKRNPFREIANRTHDLVFHN